MSRKHLAAALAAATALAGISQSAAAETRVTYKSAKSTSSYYQMAVQIAEAMKAGSGGEIIVTDPAFALFSIAGMRVGIGSVGCSFMTPHTEYPHIAFNADAGALARMKDWLADCGVPTSGFWTRRGIETLMFFRDPSGNVIELFCDTGFEGAADLPKGPSRGHGTTIDIDALAYASWRLPSDTA